MRKHLKSVVLVAVFIVQVAYLGYLQSRFYGEQGMEKVVQRLSDAGISHDQSIVVASVVANATDRAANYADRVIFIVDFTSFMMILFAVSKRADKS